MELELFAQINPNNNAYQAGQLIGILIAMFISASIPISFGAKRGQTVLGIVGAVCAVPAAFVLGCLGGLPVALVFVGIIAVVSSEGGTRKKRKKKPGRWDDGYELPRRSRRAAYDEDDDDRPRRSRRGADDDDDDRPRGSRRVADDEDDDRPRRSRRWTDDEDDEDDRSERKRKGKSLTGPGILLLVIGGLLLVGMLVTIIVVAIRVKSPDKQEQAQNPVPPPEPRRDPPPENAPGPKQPPFPNPNKAAKPADKAPRINEVPPPVPPGSGMRSTEVRAIQAYKLVGDLIWNPTGDAFFGLTSDGVLKRVSVPELAVEKEVALGQACSFLALSAQGLLVANQLAQEVWVVDPASFEVKKKISAPSVQRVLSGPRLHFALVTSIDKDRSNSKVAFLDLAKGKIVEQFKVPALFARMTPDGKHYFAQGGVEELCHYRIEGTKLINDGKSGRIASNGQNVCVSPDSKLVCLTAGGGNGKFSTNIYECDNVGNPLTGVNSGAYPHVVGFDSAARLIYAQNHEFHLVVYDMNGGKLHEYLPTRNAGDARQLVAHPQGGKLLVATTQQVIFVALLAQ